MQCSLCRNFGLICSKELKYLHDFCKEMGDFKKSRDRYLFYFTYREVFLKTNFFSFGCIFKNSF